MSSTPVKLVIIGTGVLIFTAFAVDVFLRSSDYVPGVVDEACSAMRSADLIMDNIENSRYLRNVRPTQAMVDSLPPMEERLRTFLPNLNGDFRDYVFQQAGNIARTYEELSDDDVIFQKLNGINSYMRKYNEDHLKFCVGLG
jgi:hypothetical protein